MRKTNQSIFILFRIFQWFVLSFILLAAVQLPTQIVNETMKAYGIAPGVMQAITAVTTVGEFAWGKPAVAQAASLSPGVLTPMVPPNFTVSIDSGKTGVTNGLCVAFLGTCPTLTGTANVVNSTTTDGARLTIPIAVGASGRIAVVDADGYSGGHFAGFRIKDETGLGLSLLSGMTIKTYEAGVLRESKNSSSLLDLSLGGGVSTVGFVTSLSFDEIQLEVATVVGALRDYTIYYAVVRTPLPAFTLAKSGPTTVGRNIPFAYTLTLTNTGLAATNDTITLSDALPASVSPISASTSDNFDCTLSSTVNCTSNEILAVGESATVTLNVNAAAAGPILNVATISGGGTLVPVASNSVATQISLLPALTIAKSAPATATQGEPYTYTITIANSGSADTSSLLPILVADTLPVGMDYLSATGDNGFSCGLILLAVTCTTSNVLSVGESATIEIVVEPTGLGSVGNTALVSGGGTLLDVTSNLVQTLINGLPTFTIDKEAPASVTQAEPFTYTITLTNSGAGPTFGPLPVTVIDTLPVGVSYLSATGNKGFSCGALLLVVTCTSSNTFAVGDSATIEILVDPTGLGTVSNLATVTGGGTLLGVDSNLVDTLINGLPSFTITKSAPVTATQGTTFTYSINITNTGDAATFGPLPITIVDALPVGVTYVDASGENGFSCSALALVVECSSSNTFDVGESATIEIVVQGTGLGTVGNTAIVSGGGTLLAITSNLVETLLETLTTVVVFDINKEAPTAVIEDEPITYTITITNVGTSDSSAILDVAVVDLLPLGVDYVSATGDFGFSCGVAAQLVTCTTSDVFAIGDSATIEIIAQPNGLGLVSNTALVTGGGSLFDVTSNLANTLVSGRPAFTIDKEAPATVTQGEALTYTITITNSGNGATFAPLPVIVVDTLPVGMSYVDATGNNGFSCSAIALAVTCTSSNIFSVGETATIEIVVEPTGLGLVSNTAAVSGGGTLLAITSNLVETLINGLPAFTIDKQAPATADQGVPFTYTITLTNTGDAATTGLIPVIVADTLPVGVSYQSATGDNGFICSDVALLVTCTTSNTFAVGEAATIEIVVEPNGLGLVANTAAVSGGGTLLAITSNLVETLINGMPAFAIDVAGPADVTQDQPFTLTLTITNVGSASTIGQINLIDALPLGLDFISANGDSGFTCTEALGIVTCSSSDVLAVGSHATITLVVNPSGVGTVGNTAIVSGGGALLAVTSDLFDILITGLPAFTINKEAPATADEGVPFTYTITLTNTGSAATNALIPVIVADALPVGVSYESATGDKGFSCNAAGLLVTCTTSDVFAIGESATIEIVVTPSALGTVGNTAISSGGGTLLAITSNLVETLINGMPAFAIDVAGPADVTQDQLFTLTLTITNVGSAPTFGQINLIDALPLGLDFISANGDSGFTCNEALGIVTCSSNDALAVGSHATITLVVNPSGVGTVGNTAIVSGGGALLAVTSDLFDILITGLPAFTIVLDGPAVATQNVPFTYTIAITNSGSAPTTGLIQVVDALPLGVTYVSASGTSDFACDEASRVVTCTTGTSIAVGDTATIHLTVNPDGIGLISNLAALTGDNGLTENSNLVETEVMSGTLKLLTLVLDLPLNAGNPLNHSSAAAFIITGESAPDVSVLLTVSDSNNGTVTQSVMTDANGHFTATMNVSSLADGTLMMAAVATDSEGRQSEPATSTILMDTVAPPAAIMVTPTEGSILTEKQPAISGTGEAGATLIVTIDGQVLTTTVDSAGNWTVLPAELDTGDYTPLLTITDSAGNSTGPTLGNHFTIVLSNIPDRDKLDKIIYLPLVNN